MLPGVPRLAAPAGVRAASAGPPLIDSGRSEAGTTGREREMPRNRKLAGKLCYLSPPEPADAEPWARWLTDLDVALPLGGEATDVIGPPSQASWIDAIVAKGQPVFTIVELASDEPIGRCLLFAVNQVDRCAEAGIFIGEKDRWGKGIGTEAMSLLLDYAFNLLNLESVMIGVFDFNARALASYRRLGFREIGRRRACRRIAGQAHDLILLDMLASEFSSPAVAGLMREVASPPRGPRG
jgi:RimJ/RimL family protein N-acetyltransferase